MKNLNREEAIRLLFTDAVYDSLDLESFYDEEQDRYISMYDIMYELGVSESDIDEAFSNK
jgi:hypothetical protein